MFIKCGTCTDEQSDSKVPHHVIRTYIQKPGVDINVENTICSYIELLAVYLFYSFITSSLIPQIYMSRLL